MAVKTDPATEWQLRVTPGPNETQVSYVCPTCGTAQTLNVEPGTTSTQLWCPPDGKGVTVTLPGS